jgi:YggT family protein
MQFLDLLFNLAAGLFLLRLFFNEVNPNPFNRVVTLLHRVTEPVLAPIRKILPLSLRDRLYLDVSPIIAVILIIGLKFLTIKIVSTVFLRLKG